MVFNLAWFLIWRFLANAHQRQIKDRIKICLHKDGVVLTAPDAKINTGKILFGKKKRQLKYTPNLPVIQYLFHKSVEGAA